MGELGNLNLLDLRCTVVGIFVFGRRRCITRTPSGILSRLRKLEELYVGVHFVKNRDQDNSTSVTELNLLSHLKRLQIGIPGSNSFLLQLKDLHFQNLIEFDISMWSEVSYSPEYQAMENSLSFRGVDRTLILENNINVLLRRTKKLALESVRDLKNVVRDLDEQEGFVQEKCDELEYVTDAEIYHGSLLESSFERHYSWRNPIQRPSLGNLRVLLPNVKSLNVGLLESINLLIKGTEMQDGSLYNLQQLSLVSCTSLETIFDIEGLKFRREHAEVTLGQLESVNLTSLREVMRIWRMVPKGLQGFHNLRSLTVSTCGGLRYILTPSVAKIVVNLQELILTCCRRVEEVINMEDEENGSKIEMMDKVVLPQLHSLQLQQLDNITVFCGGKYNLDVPLLEKLTITSCPNMTSFCTGYLNAPKLE
ncbi:hypothetical protein LguiB_005475 [Lonicera macranthoides]